MTWKKISNAFKKNPEKKDFFLDSCKEEAHNESISLYLVTYFPSSFVYKYYVNTVNHTTFYGPSETRYTILWAI